MKLIVSLCLLIASALAFAEGDATRGQAKSAPCAACHGLDGNSQADIYPSIAGQNSKYLFLQMKAIKLGTREAPLMAGQLNAMSDQDLHDLASYYEAQKAAIGGADSSDAKRLALGQSLYRGGSISKGLSACIACHAPRGTGNSLAGFPRIAGQLPAYTIASLTAYREGKRGQTPLGFIMQQVATPLTDKEIEALAHYVYGLH